MQKSKSLLLKILMVVMVLCCALFSLAGCSEATNGKDGVNGAAGVGIQKVEIVDGELVVTLTNGTTQTAGSIAGATCGHDKSLVSTKIINLDGTDADACKAKLHTCKACNVVTAEFIAHENVVDVEDTASTCTVQGYGAGKQCKDCGWTSSAKKDLLPHNWDEEVETKYDQTSLSVCEQGYSELKTCKDCGAVEVIAYHAPAGHKGTLEVTSDLPTLTKAGKFALDCEVCGEKGVLVDAPILSAEAYTIEVTKSTQQVE